MKVKVIKTFKYTEEVIVEVAVLSEAKDAAMNEDGERMNDDWLYSCEVVGVVKDEEV